METLNIFEAVYLGPTSTTQARVKIISHRFEKSRIYPLDFRIWGLEKQAQKILTALGYTVTGYGESKRGYMLVVQEFNPDPFTPLELTK